jgi:endonuclease/exonuclease/phosphatase family metal-dependent hydrolase
MLRDLHERLPDYRWVGVGRDDGLEAGEFTPILFFESRVALLEHATFWLSATCEKASRGWDAAKCRIVTWARFRENTSGCEFVHFNTHFDHMGRNARRESAILLLKKAAAIGRNDPLVVTGDLNCREGSAPYRVLTNLPPFDKLTAKPLRDTFLSCEKPPEGPRRTYLGLLGLLGLGRIDYIFVSDAWRVTAHRVLTGHVDASDHRPVIAEIQFAEG